MRVTIIPADRIVLIDGIGFNNIDMAAMPTDIHAIQWFGDYGDVEIKDPATGRIVQNKTINSLAPYQFALLAWENAKTIAAAEIPVTTL